MKIKALLIVVVALAAAGLISVVIKRGKSVTESIKNAQGTLPTQSSGSQAREGAKENSPEAREDNSQGLQPPLSDYQKRITKKSFGIKITPQTSPVQPERFSGYHTGTDFEILQEELNETVSVSAVCSGEIIQKKTVGGYGGVIIQKCELDGQPVTVLYGHISLMNSTSAQVGNQIAAGEQIAVLGKDKSAETDGERKHLHLGIHKGEAIDVRGYVQNKSGLEQWVDFEEMVK